MHDTTRFSVFARPVGTAPRFDNSFSSASRLATPPELCSRRRPASRPFSIRSASARMPRKKFQPRRSSASIDPLCEVGTLAPDFPSVADRSPTGTLVNARRTSRVFVLCSPTVCHRRGGFIRRSVLPEARSILSLSILSR